MDKLRKADIYILMRIVYRERSCRYSMLHHLVDG